MNYSIVSDPPLTSKKSVVLADDDKDVLTVLRKGLEANSYQVYAIDSPLEALEYIKSTHSPQLLICDIRMPAPSGFEMARRIKDYHPEIMIMLLTAFEIDKSEFNKVFPSTRIDALVNKPVTIRKLIDVVNALMVNCTNY